MNRSSLGRKSDTDRSKRQSSKRGYWLPAATFAVSGFAVSYLLIPRDYELAMEEISAGEPTLAIRRLESLESRGEGSPAVAAALAFARAETGDLEGAILGLEEISRDRPHDMSILAALGDFYIGVGRVSDHLAVLERQQLIDPEYNRQARIADLYGQLGDVARQRAALWTLVQAYNAGNESILELARLEAAEGRQKHALKALDLQQRAYPDTVSSDAVSLAISIELALGEDRQALERSRHWLARQTKTSTTLFAIANAFQTQNRPDLVVELLEPMAVKEAPLAVFTILAESYYKLGDAEASGRIFTLIEAFFGEQPEVTQAQLMIGYMIADSQKMLQVARKLPIQDIPPGLLKSVAAAAMGRNDGGLLRAIVNHVGKDFLGADPVFAARVSIAMRDFEAASSWVEVARSVGEADPAVLLGAAIVDAELGRKARSLQTLRSLFAEVEAIKGSIQRGEGRSGRGVKLIPRESLIEAAGLYISLGAPNEGRLALSAYRRVYPSREADFAWALAAAASAVDREVLEWLADLNGDHPMPPEFLHDLAGYAMTAAAYDLAASAASRLVAARGTDADKMLMAKAALSASRPLRVVTTTSLYR